MKAALKGEASMPSRASGRAELCGLGIVRYVLSYSDEHSWSELGLASSSASEVNKLTSAKTQLPYSYYTLAYCTQGPQRAERKLILGVHPQLAHALALRDTCQLAQQKSDELKFRARFLAPPPPPVPLASCRFSPPLPLSFFYSAFRVFAPPPPSPLPWSFFWPFGGRTQGLETVSRRPPRTSGSR